jgi:hypothetical protein
MFLREGVERRKYSLRTEGERDTYDVKMLEDTNGGVGKLLNNNAVIINEEIPHQKITGCTNIVYVKKGRQFFYTILSVNWKNKCTKILNLFKNNRKT